jgi:hypothetical protein
VEVIQMLGVKWEALAVPLPLPDLDSWQQVLGLLVGCWLVGWFWLGRWRRK